MNTKYLFPLLLIALDVGAAIIYGINKQGYKNGYILGCGGCTQYLRYVLKRSVKENE